MMGVSPYRIPATPLRPRRSTRVPGAVVVATLAGVGVFVALGMWLAMRHDTSDTVVVPLPSPPVITNLPDTPEVILEGSWGEDAHLIGVDREKKTALLKLVQHGNQPRLVWSLVDLEKHAMQEQWEATPENAKKNVTEYPPAFGAISGTFTGDLVKLAGLVRRHAEDGAMAFGADPMMAVSSDGSKIVYDQIPTNGHDGDELVMVDADGSHPRRIDAGLVASYDPVFSPNGEWVAMRACGRPCDYFLYLSHTANRAAPVRVRALDNPRRHVFAADGKSVFVLTRHTDDQAAFWEVPLDAPDQPKKIYENQKMKSAELFVSPDRKTAVIAGRQRFVFVDLDTRTIFRNRVIDSGNLASMGPGGVLMSSDRAGTLFYDPKADREWSKDNAGWYLQPYWAAWESPGTVIAVRTKPAVFQIVRLRN